MEHSPNSGVKRKNCDNIIGDFVQRKTRKRVESVEVTEVTGHCPAKLPENHLTLLNSNANKELQKMDPALTNFLQGLENKLLTGFEEVKTEVRELKVDVKDLNNWRPIMEKRMEQCETYNNRPSFEPSSEVKVSGIPLSVTLNPGEIVRKVLAFIGVDSPGQGLVDAREVKYLTDRMMGTEQMETEAAPAAPTVNAGTRSRTDFRTDFKSVIAVLSCPTVKDNVMRRKRSKGEVLAIHVFPDSGASPTLKIFFNEIFQPDVFELMKEARILAKRKGYLAPWVSGSRILTKRSRNAPVVEIRCVSDLQKLGRVDN